MASLNRNGSLNRRTLNRSLYRTKHRALRIAHGAPLVGTKTAAVRDARIQKAPKFSQIEAIGKQVL